MLSFDERRRDARHVQASEREADVEELEEHDEADEQPKPSAVLAADADRVGLELAEDEAVQQDAHGDRNEVHRQNLARRRLELARVDRDRCAQARERLVAGEQRHPVIRMRAERET